VKILWSEPAELDLDDLFDYIARDSPVYAERFVDRIIDAVDKLIEHPRIGRAVPEGDSEHVRELVVQDYRVIYAIDDDTINVLAVVHGRTDLVSKEHKPWQ
jgi:toxin ParE1/3/4